MIVMNPRVRYGLKMETVYYHDNVDEYRTDKDIVLFYNATQFPKTFHYGSVTHTMIEDLTQDEAVLLAKIRTRSKRYLIKAMDMDCLRIEEIEHPTEEDFITFFKHYDRFARIMKLNMGSLKYVNDLNKTGCAHIMYIRYTNQEVLAAGVYLTFPDLGRLSYGFANFRLYEDKEMQKLCSLSNLKMYWSELLKCKKAGCKILDYGGLGLGIYNGKLDSIDHFKMGFNGQIVQQHTFYRPYTWKGYFIVWLMKMRKKNLYVWQN
jgi:hypothetical protein